MKENFDYGDDRTEEEEKYSKLDIIGKALDTLECLGMYNRVEELLIFLGDFHRKTKIKQLIRNFNKEALQGQGVNPIRHIDERAEALEYLLVCIKGEEEE